MGADGHITIWRDDKVREHWPDCDKLFACLSTHYLDEMDGVKYHHCYHGDNMYSHWGCEEDWYLGDGIQLERLKLFVEWLEGNGTQWEVWT